MWLNISHIVATLINITGNILPWKCNIKYNNEIELMKKIMGRYVLLDYPYSMQ